MTTTGPVGLGTRRHYRRASDPDARAIRATPTTYPRKSGAVGAFVDKPR